ncbi:MAG: caspase family protein [Treponema sp.]|jgi:uncharacterized caspase-like protein|nr:caspase family protein [Treponema sp.]
MKGLWALVLAAALALPLGAQQGGRFALVIGNNDYPAAVGALKNPVADAGAVAAKLRGLGFRVELKTNVTLRQMTEAIEQYRRSLSTSAANEGFFWFAGD